MTWGILLFFCLLLQKGASSKSYILVFYFGWSCVWRSRLKPRVIRFLSWFFSILAQLISGAQRAGKCVGTDCMSHAVSKTGVPTSCTTIRSTSLLIILTKI